MEPNFGIIITGIFIAILILASPFIGLLITVTLIPQSLLQAMGGTILGIFSGATPIKIVGGITFISTFLQHLAAGKKWDFLKRPQIKFFSFFFLWILISGFTQPGFGTRENFTIFASFAVLGFIILSLVETLKQFRIILLVGIISVFVVSISTILTSFGIGTSDAVVRMKGASYGPNEFAITLVPFIALTFYSAFTEKSKFAQILLFLMMFSIIVALVLTFSRGGIIGFFVMLALAVIKAKNKIKGLIFLGIAALIIVNAMPSYIWERFAGTQTILQNLDDTSNVETTKRRYLLAKAAWEMFLRNPVAGVGIGNYFFRGREFEKVHPGRAHTMYLEIMAELGIIGFLLFLGIIWYTLRTLGKIMKTGPPASAYARGLEIALWGFLTAALFLHAEQEKILWFIIFMVSALESIVIQPGKVRPV